MNNANSANKGEGNMESKIKDELNVFPQGERVGDVAYQLGGMSLRDYFAAMAMQGWLSTYVNDVHPATNDCIDDFCDKAYAIADGMIAARDRNNGQ